jgi:general secretion pathway protein K
VRRTGNILGNDTAMMYAMTLEDLAKLSLQRDLKSNKIDGLTDKWASEEGFFSAIEGGALGGTISDAQARINLNGVLEKETEDRLRTLCNNLQVSPEFIDALKDWIDEDVDTVSPDGAEDDYYTSLEAPYRAANRPMADIS